MGMGEARMTGWPIWPSGAQLVLLFAVLLLMHGACWWYAGRERNPYSLYYRPDWASIGRCATQRRLRSHERMMREVVVPVGDGAETAARTKATSATAAAAAATVRFPTSHTGRHRLCVGILYEDHADHGHLSNVIPLTVSELLLRTGTGTETETGTADSIAVTLFCQEGAGCDRLDSRIAKVLTVQRLSPRVRHRGEESFSSSSPSSLHLAALAHLAERGLCDYHLILAGHLFVAGDWASRLLGLLASEYGTGAPDWFAARLLTQLERSYNWDSLDMMALLGVSLSLCIMGIGLAALLYWSFLGGLRRWGSDSKGKGGRWWQSRTFAWDEFARPSMVALVLLFLGSTAVPLIVGKPTIMFLIRGFHMYDPSACGTGGFPAPTAAAAPKQVSPPPSCGEHALAILYHHTNSEHLLDLLLLGRGDHPPSQSDSPSPPPGDDFSHVAYARRPLPRGAIDDDHHINLDEGMDRVLAGLVSYNYAHGYRTPLGILLPNLFQHDLSVYGPAQGRPEEIYSFSFPEA